MNKIPKVLVIWVLAFVLWLNYSDAQELPKEPDFYLLGLVLIYNILESVPEAFKNKLYYTFYKYWLGWRKVFIYEMKNFSVIDIDTDVSYKAIEKELRDKLKDDYKDLIIDKSNLYIYNNTLEIEISIDAEEQKKIISYSILKDNYNIDTLEKDIIRYTHVISIISKLYTPKEQRITYSLKNNSYYTPDYKLKKYSKVKKPISIEIWDSINFRKDWKEESITLSGDDITTLNKNLKKYITLTLN